MNPKMYHQHTATGGGASNATATDTASVELAEITPEYARELLKRNTDNRPFSVLQCGKYKRDLASGNWSPNTALVVLGADGALCNGQHTLTAIAESGITARCIVLKNPALVDARDWYGDRGRTRRADYVHGTTRDIWSVCRMIAEHVVTHRPSDAEIASFVGPVSETMGLLSTSSARGRSATSVRVAVATLARLNPSKAGDIAQQYSAFVNRSFSGLVDSTHALSAAIADGRLRTNGEQDRNELMVRAYMAFDPARKGRAIRVCNLPARLAEVRAALRAAWLPGR